MATLTLPRVIGATGPKLTVRCTSNRRFAVVQLVPRMPGVGSTASHYRPKVLFRSDNPSSVAVKVRQLGGWSWVFDNRTGELIWNNSSSEWLAAESAILNHRDRGEN